MGKNASLIIRVIAILVAMPLAGLVYGEDPRMGFIFYALQVPLAIDTLIGWYKNQSKS